MMPPVPGTILSFGIKSCAQPLIFNDQLWVYAKQQEEQRSCTLKQVIENSLREFLSRQNSQQNTVRPETVSGAGLKPGIDLDNSRSLTDIMDGR